MPEVVVDLSPLPPVTVPTGDGSITIDAITPAAMVSADMPTITVGVPGQAGPAGPPGTPGSNGAVGPAGPAGQDAVLPAESDPNLSTDYGNTVTAGNAYQTAIGAQIGMTGAHPGSTVVGCRAGVGGQYAVAMGYGANAGANDAVAIGHNATTTDINDVALGPYHLQASLWKGTQAAYDAITTKDPNTVYVVT